MNDDTAKREAVSFSDVTADLRHQVEELMVAATRGDAQRARDHFAHAIECIRALEIERGCGDWPA